MNRDDLFERGLQVRREMFGRAGADDHTDNADDLTEKLQEMVTRYCFGDIWTRDGLNRRDRSMVTLGMLVALGRSDQVRTHIRGGVANGLTPDEIREIMLQAILYCGIPAAVDGLTAAREVLAELDSAPSEETR